MRRRRARAARRGKMTMPAPQPLRAALAGLGLAALLLLLTLGFWGTMFGAMAGAAEMRRIPAAAGVVALMVLLRGPRALPCAAGWALLGAAGAVALRAGLGVLGRDGWMPPEDASTAEILAEAAWFAVLAALAWRGGPAGLLGPLLAAVVATTRIGGYGQVLVPLAWEETLREAMLLGTSILAGFVAGLGVLLLAGWMAAIVVRLPARLLAPGRVLAALAAAAAIGHMLTL